MNWIRRHLELAAEVALADDKREHRIGAVGLRADGTIVTARNGSCPNGTRAPSAHAEARLARKLDFGSIVFVTRVSPGGRWGLAKPCARCLRVLKAHGVERVYYSVAPEVGSVGLVTFKNGAP